MKHYIWELGLKKCLISRFWVFLIKEAIKIFFDKILLDNNMTHPLKCFFQKMFITGGE